jgi:hypothetical protein
MNLRTWIMITRNKEWEQLLTNLIICAIKTMADKQGIKTLKLTGQNKTPIYRADWIEGVEYNDNKDNNNINDGKHNDEEYLDEIPDYTFDDKLDDQ